MRSLFSVWVRVMSAGILVMVAAGFASAQEAVTVTGVVTTTADGLPVPQAVVSVPETGQATTGPRSIRPASCR